MNQKPIHLNLPVALQRAREGVMSHFRPLLAERGFTEQQWRVLRVLDEEGAMDASHLAERAVLLMPSLTRILKTLEQGAWITRIRDRDDGRRALVSITDQGRDAILAGAPSTVAAYRQIEDELGAENIQTLIDLLDRLSKTQPKS